MGCKYTKLSSSKECKYCVYPDVTTSFSRKDSVKKLQHVKQTLIKKLLFVEKQLRTHVRKGGE